jgi:hypothetical protein
VGPGLCATKPQTPASVDFVSIVILLRRLSLIVDTLFLELRPR